MQALRSGHALDQGSTCTHQRRMGGSGMPRAARFWSDLLPGGACPCYYYFQQLLTHTVWAACTLLSSCSCHEQQCCSCCHSNLRSAQGLNSPRQPTAALHMVSRTLTVSTLLVNQHGVLAALLTHVCQRPELQLLKGP